MQNLGDGTIFDKTQSRTCDNARLLIKEPMRNWQPISTAPFDRDLELSVIENEKVYPLVFPCRRAMNGWVHASTGQLVRVDPTHWREWLERRPEGG